MKILLWKYKKTKVLESTKRILCFWYSLIEFKCLSSAFNGNHRSLKMSSQCANYLIPFVVNDVPAEFMLDWKTTESRLLSCSRKPVSLIKINWMNVVFISVLFNKNNRLLKRFGRWITYSMVTVMTAHLYDKSKVLNVLPANLKILFNSIWWYLFNT